MGYSQENCGAAATSSSSKDNDASNSTKTSAPTMLHEIGGTPTSIVTDSQIEETVTQFFTNRMKTQQIKNVLLIPPDYTRYHSHSGVITRIVTDFLLQHNISFTILPALGTHAPMTATQIRSMFGDTLADMTPSPFVVHDWRNNVTTIGVVPSPIIAKATNNIVTDLEYPAQINNLCLDSKFDLVLSIGQVVPHEVTGMANYNKNLLVGAGGVDAINLSHYIGAIVGMETSMGRATNPLRDILEYATNIFLNEKVKNLVYVLTVMNEGVMKGLYVGTDVECYNKAAELSRQLNVNLLDCEPLQNVVVYLDETEYHSTWLGNKAIYRTRMAMADNGHLTILAPGVIKFGEDEKVDALIRKYGYKGTPYILEQMKDNVELKENLSAVAHMIHGSTEGRFRVTYCPKGNDAASQDALTKSDIMNVGYNYGNLSTMLEKYNIQELKNGWNVDPSSGERFYFIRNPAVGLWAVRSRFEKVGETKLSSATAQISSTADDGGDMSLIQQVANDGSGGVGGWEKPPPSKIQRT